MKFLKAGKGFSSLKVICIFSLLVVVLFAACNDDNNAVPNNDDKPNINDSIPLFDSSGFDASKIYKPKQYSGQNWYDNSSQWFYGRSKQSEHFIVMWEKGFGLNPNADSVPSEYRVNIDDLLEKAESFYEINVNQLGFAITGAGISNLDNYKIMILLHYTTEWMAFGSGFDDVIGGLWVSPSTCHPVGSTIAHEIGHSFQYQTYCDLLAYEGINNDFTRGFRYGFGGNGGNAFWEQCAQWQAHQSYPFEAFNSYNFGVFLDNYHRHFGHEYHRYASYWLQYYWTQKHGQDALSRIWRESVYPEDPIEAYMKIYDLSLDEFNDEMYDAAAHLATFDLDAIRELGNNYINRYSYNLISIENDAYQVAYNKCPGTTGFNVIPLNVPGAGTDISVQFNGLYPGSELAAGDPGEYTDGEVIKTTTNYNATSFTTAGWRFGFVALLEDGTRIYSDMSKTNSISSSVNASFTVPNNCKNIWMIVLGAPTTYKRHAWDDLESNDEQWPYKVKFTNTDLYGSVKFDGTEVEQDITLTYDISFPFSETDYPGGTVAIDQVALAYAFVLQPTDISSLIGSDITFYAVESDGTLNSTNTANGYGHWFDANGDVISWGTGAQVFSEFNESDFTFAIGQYPGHCASGDNYTVKQALVYEYETGKTVQATFVFNINIE